MCSLLRCLRGLTCIPIPLQDQVIFAIQVLYYSRTLRIKSYSVRTAFPFLFSHGLLRYTLFIKYPQRKNSGGVYFSAGFKWHAVYQYVSHRFNVLFSYFILYFNSIIYHSLQISSSNIVMQKSSTSWQIKRRNFKFIILFRSIVLKLIVVAQVYLIISWVQ